MKSKTSFFSKTLFNKNLKRYWPVWVILTIFALLVPVYVGIQIGREYTYGSEALALEIKRLYYDFISKGNPIVAMFVACVVALCVWNYLYFQKSAGGMHSYPLSRTTLFVTNYLSGLAMMLIPYAIGGSVLVILVAAHGAGVPACTWTLILSILCTTVFYFSFATLIAHITSHIIALPVLYGMFMALEPIVVWLVGIIATGFLYGVEFDYWHKLDILCPFYYMLRKVENVVDYNNPLRFGNEYAAVYNCELKGFPVQIIYAAAGLVIAFGTYHIYKRRKNETAGDVIAVKALKPIIITILTFISTSCGTLILYVIFCDDVDDTRLVPFILCMLVAATISYYVSNMIVEKKVNVFNKRTGIGFAVCLVVGIGASVIMSADLFNIEKYIPENSDFEEVWVRVENNDFTFVPGKDDAQIEEVKKLHKVLSESENETVEVHTTEEPGYTYGIYTTFEYNRNDEEAVRRSYNPIIGENIDSPSSKAVYEFCSKPEILLQLFHLDDGMKLSYLNVETYKDGVSEYYNMEGDNLTKLHDALISDIKEENWNPLDRMLSEKDGEIRIELSYGKWERSYYGEVYRENEWVTVYLNPGMDHTLKALREITGLSEKEMDDIMNWVDPNTYDYTKEYYYGGVNYISAVETP